ncbi:hypothetical protein V5E97_15350 [Singulisphaera sp. Ch08]|uniref:Carboxypeptidase regulatory-like domain-containing protein n=1 Tax=Singulisphaera sp. Ch08 TaxID=3120278 RepID=A0AAU7CQG5_9BACT
MLNHARTGSIVFAGFATLTLSTHLVGCGSADNLPRESVSGSVAIEGKPLAKGLITFLPSDSEIPTQGGGVIVDGKYSIPKDQGLVPGKYKIVISSTGDKPETVVDKTNDMPGMPPVLAKEAIPSQYNKESLLTADVKSGGKNVYEFNLTSASVGK